MSEPPEPDEPRAARPWWSYAVPWAGNVPKLSRHQWGVLGLLSAAEFFEHYDVGLMSLALAQLQADLQIPEAQIGQVSAIARLGVLPAILLTVMADRVGRRRLLLLTIVGFTVTTFLTAFSQNAEQYIALQFASRFFIAGEAMLAVVVLTEELQARDRGWGIGMLGALGALGHGGAALVFGFVDVLPYGWRAMYAIGVVPLIFLAWFRRNLRETQRFEDHRATRSEGGSRSSFLHPVRSLFRMYPGRLAALSLAVLAFDFVIATAYTFVPKTLQELHGYTPGSVSTLMIVGGALGILGNIAAGSLADRFGRRVVLIVAIGANAGAIYAFYHGSGLWIPPAWIFAIFTITGISVLFKALGSELFPTSYRSTASGVRAVASTVGGSAGLVLEGFLYTQAGSHALAITWMMPVLILPPLVILLFVPETATRELEEIAPER
ncbi:MAG: MFS transporter [Myxococcales bacterium]|nr:MFS transporter [Myxococcales bacterium]